MSDQTGPVRYDLMFSMSEASHGRVNQLLQQCGHNNVNLLLARGLALVQWVEEQQDLGRTIGAVLYDGESVDVAELSEREELLRPQPRPQALPVRAIETTEKPLPVRNTAPAPAPAPEPVPLASTDASVNPKLVAREKKPGPPAAPPRYRAPSGREQQLRAHIPNDVGPVKTYTWVRWRAELDGRKPPILIGDDRVLPGELTVDHLSELERMLVDAKHATHFQVGVDGFLSYYAFLPGNGTRGGWRYVEEGSMQLRKDPHLEGGLFAIFPVIMAVEYLRRQASPSRTLTSV